LKPDSVLQAQAQYYQSYTANIKRGIYASSVKATQEYERAREAVATLINASQKEIVFTRNTTEGINLIMYALATNVVRPGDEIVTTIMEHHSNFVPWQQIAAHTNAVFKLIHLNSKGKLGITDEQTGEVGLDGVITKKTKLLCITHVSNVLGTINPIASIVKRAREINPGIIVIVDGAQAVGHIPVDVKALDCDFYAFSGHKMFGPTGAGVLYGKKTLLDSMHPFMYGGDMIEQVSVHHTTFAQSPDKFEAGTPAIAEVIGMGEAARFISNLDLEAYHSHIQSLHQNLRSKMIQRFGAQLTEVSTTDSSENVGIYTFAIAGVHPHDVASVLDEDYVAVRAGHHCAMPLHKHLNLPATTRVSLHIYNTESDVEVFLASMSKVMNHFL
jgi:cysteine desulfurase/selenocysteine lyase